MNCEIEYFKKDNYVKVICKGSFSIGDLPEYFKKLLASAFWKPGMNLLVDNQNLILNQNNSEKMRTACNEYHLVSRQLGEGKIALLMNSVVNYGFGRQFQLLSEDKGQSEIRIFNDEKRAHAWMSEEKSLSLD